MPDPEQIPEGDPAPAFDPEPPQTDPDLPTEPDIAPAIDPEVPPTTA